MTNSDYLTLAENRLASVQSYYPTSSEVARLQFVVADISNKLTTEELDFHKMKKIETPAGKIARLKEESRQLRLMEMNKDSNSI